MPRPSTALFALAAALSLAGTAASVAAEPSPAGDRWQFSLTPYAWLPSASFSADTSVVLPGPEGRERQVDIQTKTDPGSYLSNLNFAGMLTGEARKGRWSVFTDIIYTDFGNQASRVRELTGPRGRTLDLVGKADMSLSALVWTLGGGYTVAEGAAGNLDLFAGVRLLSMNSDATLTTLDARGRPLRSRSASLDEEAWDGIAGIRGRILLNQHWFVPYYADVGAGTSNWTWQALLGLGYQFKWGDVLVAARSLSYHFDDSNTDLTLTGPAIGVGFHW